MSKLRLAQVAATQAGQGLRFATVTGHSARHGLRFAAVTGHGITEDLVWNGTTWVNFTTYTPPTDNPPPPVVDYPPTDGFPTLIVEFDAAPPRSDEFVLDRDLLDGVVPLGADGPRWIRANASGVQALRINRGRQDTDRPVEAGVLTLECDNYSGDFDPDNRRGLFAQPFEGSPFRTGMACRVSAIYPTGLTEATAIFTGTLANVDVDRGFTPRATLTFTDDMVALANQQVPSFDDAVRAEDTWHRAQWLVTMTPLHATEPVFSDYLTRNLLPTYGGGTVLDELEQVATAEQGRVFCDVENRLRVTTHSDVYAQFTAANLTDRPGVTGGVEFESLTSSVGKHRVVNSVTLARYSRDSTYADIKAGDGASIDRHGLKSIPGGTVIAPLADEQDAKDLATYLATRRSTPLPTIPAVRVNFAGQGNAWALLTADLGTQLTVSRTSLYADGKSVTVTERDAIEGMVWTVGPDQFDLDLFLAPVDLPSLFGSSGVFLLDVSYLDGVDVLAANY